MTSKGPPPTRAAIHKRMNNTIAEDIDENNWFDDLNDNVPKLPTNGMPHAAYKIIIRQSSFGYIFPQTHPQLSSWQRPVPQHPLQLLEELFVSNQGGR